MRNKYQPFELLQFMTYLGYDIPWVWHTLYVSARQQWAVTPWCRGATACIHAPCAPQSPQLGLLMKSSVGINRRSNEPPWTTTRVERTTTEFELDIHPSVNWGVLVVLWSWTQKIGNNMEQPNNLYTVPAFVEYQPVEDAYYISRQFAYHDPSYDCCWSTASNKGP